jgi:hypothetical protein
MANLFMMPMVASARMAAQVWSSLYDAVAVGMYAYSRSAFRVRVVAPSDERIEEGTLYVAAHRAETDVPVICGSYYFAARVWRQASPRLQFAARDDLFEPGFFAGFPPGQPRLVRRALHGMSIGEHLPRVKVYPISSATTMKLAQALAMIDAETRVEDALPDELMEPLLARGAELAKPRPVVVGDLQHGDYVDLLWRDVVAADLAPDVFREAWARRAAAATGDLRTVMDVVRNGEALLLFPEGRPSPDGALGPLQRGMGAILRRGKPARLRVFGLAYDPLTTGRTNVVLTVRSANVPPTGPGEPDLLPDLARSIALTSGQVVAAALLGAASSGRLELAPAELAAQLADATSESEETSRTIDPILEVRDSARKALDDAVRASERRGLISLRGPRKLDLNPEAIANDPVIARLAAEQAAVRAELVGEG